MKVSVLMGSPLQNGNTATIVKPFVDQLKNENVEVDYITLYDKSIKGCIDCRACQKVNDVAGCSIKDDMDGIYESLLSSDCIVFATPIFTWFCTAPMKAVLDRIFAFGKYYNDVSHHQAMLKGKSFAMIATCGDEIDRGIEGFELAMKNIAIYAEAEYIGSYNVRDINGIEDFKTAEASNGSVEFANKVIGHISK